MKGCELPVEPAPTRKTAWRKGLRNLGRHRTALVGVGILMAVILMALAAPWLAPHDPRQQDLSLRLHPPGWAEGGDPSYPLGTDQMGRDILSRIIYGARVSLAVGFIAVAISGTLGVSLGLLSGYFGGRLDDVIMRVADIQLAFPFILLALAVMTVLGSGLRNIIIVLGITGWVQYGRIIRSEVLRLRSTEFIEAAHSIGNSDLAVIWRHVLPNVISSAIVIASLQVARVVVSESALTFLGLGIEPTIPSWGGMLSDGRDYINTQWWVSTFPGLALMLTVLGWNLVGDWLRDSLDPRAR